MAALSKASLRSIVIILKRVLPTLVISLVPFLFFKDDYKSIDFGIFQYLGIPLIALGMVIAMVSLWQWDKNPSNELFVEGLYKYSRNPQYLGDILILSGNVFLISSFKVLKFTILMFIFVNILIYFIEEPKLKKEFGESYNEYCKKVGRWFIY